MYYQGTWSEYSKRASSSLFQCRTLFRLFHIFKKGEEKEI